MRKFNKLFVVGTKVKIAGSEGWHMITDINDTRVNIKVADLAGSFQRSHVVKFTNKKYDVI